MANINTYTVHDGQTLFDVAIHKFGDPNQALPIAMLNGYAEVTDLPAAGDVLLLPDAQPIDYVVTAINNRNIVPATANPQ